MFIFIKLILCILGGIAAFILQKVVISIISAFLGSYLIVLNIHYILDFFRFNKSITSFAQYGDYFNEIVLSSNSSVILTAIAILAIIGFLAQWKLLPKKQILFNITKYSITEKNKLLVFFVIDWQPSILRQQADFFSKSFNYLIQEL